MEPDGNTEGGNREELAHKAHAVGVADSTCSADNKANYEIDGRRGSGEVSSDDTTNELEDVSIPTTQEASQLPPFRGSSEEDVIVINDSDDDDDDGGNRSVRAGIGSQEQENPSAVIPKLPLEECSIGPHDIISPKSDDSRAHRSVSVPQQGLRFAPRAPDVSESLYLTSSDGQAQDIVPPSRSPFITKAQPRKIKRVVDQSESLAFKTESGVGNSESESDSDDKGHAWRLSDAQLVRKRKRGTSVCAIANKRHRRTSNKTSKLRPTAAADATKQQKQLHYLCSSRKAKSATCIPEIRYDGDTGAEDSSDGTENHHNSRSAKAENSKKAYKLEFDCSSPNKDTEYEVERILAVRLCYGHLQYRVLWAGYEADSTWYNASNFKNSPHKLREFHKAKPTELGPPVRLGHWEQCWEEERDADNFPDDDQPERTARGRRTVKSGRADT